MKRYTSRATKWLAIPTLISVVILSIGIAFIAMDSLDFGIQIGLTIGGGVMSIIFLSIFLGERSRYLIIDANKIVLPRGANKNGKMSFTRTVINISEINSVESKLNKGDGFFIKDTYFHTLKLKDGTKIIFPLYAYGKNAEKEILETIHKKVH